MTSLPDLIELVVSAYGRSDPEAAVVATLLVLAWLALPVYCLWKALKKRRLTMLMRCLPTSKVRGVFIGLSEVKGLARWQSPLYSYLAERECVWFSYSVQEEWRRTEVQYYRDSNGRMRTRTVVRSGWTTIMEGCSTEPFELVDDTGAICVWPQGATVEDRAFLDRVCDRRHAMYYDKGPEGEIAYSTHRRRFIERGIDVQAPLYIIGTTRLQENAIHPEFANCNKKDPYLISVHSEERITRFNAFCAAAIPWLGVLVLLLPSFIEPYEFPKNIYNTDFDFLHQSVWLHVALIYVAYWVFHAFWQWYVEMVAARNRVMQGIAQVDVQLQRRYDLIQQLVDVVEAYCRHEQALQERVAELRARIKDGQADMLAEAYPDLKANTLFSRLQQELADTEERLALACEYRNTIGNFYNTRLQLFPGGLILRMLGFRDFYVAE